MSSYVPRLSEHGQQAFDREIKEDRKIVEAELDKCGSKEQEAKYRHEVAKGFKSKANDLMEEAHMYVREAHATRNPESSQRVNNVRTASTITLMCFGLVLRAGKNVGTGA